ncbi:phosphatidylinositol-specific phospholipase C1-like protein [Chryseobacterium sp. D764]|uniref:phosphatidylinositol-specific phospholipase C1-like protein n=1 Tax=Chryseobacterium sp. D764 TaxID=2856522 RepID=UPI001C59D6CF|nr:phosphatidylinositol-specific phospholipase C1-like protein [Chryseobacterium sp. D764]QXU47937.1 phosphatidylinositol-specific phospholipase C1-like protein [Chryseobacterium sp. D764]
MKKAVFLGICLSSFNLYWSQSQQLDELKINEIQIIGSHNSYKKAILPEVYHYLSQKDTQNSLPKIQYEHIPIPQQLDLGLRNLEIDVYADSKGEKYAHPKILDLVKTTESFDPEGKMKKPGYKMIHITDIDFQTWYYTLEECLKDLKKWSDRHPDHDPVFITLEPKDGKANQFGTEPEHYTNQLFNDLDNELKKYLGKEKIITPDDIRGSYKTLNEAVLNKNWPKVKDAKGKFLFVLDNNGENRDLYAMDHPSLKGRMIFTNSTPGTQESAVLFMNEPKKDDVIIKDLVKKGYIIRTRADADTMEARSEDYSRFEKAKESGAQIITTDYYYPSKLFKSNYKVGFDNNTYERKNPITGN